MGAVRARLAGDAAGGVAHAPRQPGAVALDVTPRDRKLFRAVEKTYLKPAPSQELAAEQLGIPYSSFRRHLTAGVEAIAEALWQKEVG